MIKSASQLKGKIKNLSDKDAEKAESYVSLFFMRRSRRYMCGCEGDRQRYPGRNEDQLLIEI